MEEGTRRREAGIFILAASFEAILLASLAFRHSINPDEGFYLAGGARLLQGEHIYRDFFFPQMPYLPYVQSWLMALGGPSILLGRLVSIVPAGLTVGLLAAAVWRWTRALPVVAAVVTAYATHVLFWNYLTVIKTYGLANLWLVWAFLVIASRTTGVRAFTSGICCGLAIGTRLPAVAVVAVLGLYLIWRAPRRLPGFFAGIILALLPCLWIASRDLDAFWFGNFGFHTLRKEIQGLIPILSQKGLILLRWMLLPQNFVLWVLAALGAAIGGERSRLALICAGALAVIYLTATPTYLEYTAQMVPFLLIASVPALQEMMSRRRWWIAATAVYAVGLIVALRPAASGSYRGQKLVLWQMDTVDRVSEILHREAAPDDMVLSWWEGYPVLARRPGITGVGFWESNVAKKLPPEARQRYHVLGRGEIRALVQARRPRLVVSPEGVWEDLSQDLDSGYKLIETIGKIRIYRRASGAEMPIASQPEGGA